MLMIGKVLKKQTFEEVVFRFNLAVQWWFDGPLGVVFIILNFCSIADIQL